jgi:hypothetical protein
MIVKDIVASKTDQSLFASLLTALDLSVILYLLDDRVVNLFEEFAVVFLRIHHHLSLLGCESIVKTDLLSLQRTKGLGSHSVFLSQIFTPASFRDIS